MFKKSKSKNSLEKAYCKNCGELKVYCIRANSGWNVDIPCLLCNQCYVTFEKEMKQLMTHYHAFPLISLGHIRIRL